MIKRIAMVVMALLTVTAPFLLQFQPVSADNSNGITGQYLLNSDDGNHLTDNGWCASQNKQLSWPTALATCNIGGGTIASFNKASSSYSMFRDNQPSPPITISCGGSNITMQTNRFTIYVASPNHKMTFYKGLDQNNTEQYYLTSDATFYEGNIIAEPNSDPAYKCNWTGSYSADQYETTSAGQPIDPNAISGFRGIELGSDLQAGQVGAVNANYSASWDLSHFTSSVPYGEDGSTTCATLDIGCWVSKLTSGFTDVVKSLFSLMVNAFQWLFVPDSGQVQAEFNTVNSDMTTKLGFFTYPFTFIGNVFSSFTSGSSWCNDTSCQKDFGQFFGHDFNVNLGQMETTMPTVWTWFTAMIRGLTILTLLFAVRNKYRSVTAK